VLWLADLLLNALRLFGRLMARLGGSPPEFVVVELSGSYPERAAVRPPLLQRLVARPWQRHEESLEELRDRLDRIARAEGVRGVVLRLRDLRVAPGRIAVLQSLRAAVADLRHRGKRVAAYLTVCDLPAYYVAAAADEVWMAEAGIWDVPGLRAEVTFFREALDRLGVLPEFERIAEYKTAADPLMRAGLSEPHREVIESLLDAMLAEIVRDIADGRGLDPAAVRAAMDRAPLEADAARAAGLVDGLCYEDELPGALAGSNGQRRRVVLQPWSQARRRLPARYRWRAREAVIGVVELIGNIVPGESRDLPVPLPLLGGRFAGSETVARAFRAAERHPRIRAIVFHIDSGGGSALASDLIWREVERIKRTKPVVAHMGNVAGSGGYYVACGASRIVAQPATITGSIGVVNGKLTMRGLYARLGLNREVVARGEAATLDSAFAPFTPAQRERMREQMEIIYRRFIARVAGGRAHQPEQIGAVARGRVWTGRQALERGLVDEMGDFAVAVRRARDLAGIAAETPVAVVTIRPPRAVQVPGGGVKTGDAPLLRTLLGAADGLRAVCELLEEGTLLLVPELFA
jgi:protease-4